MRAFVAGATGYTGRNLVEHLGRAGHTVMAHVRPGSRSLRALASRFEAAGAVIDGTPWVRGELMATLAAFAPTHVFALLGTTAARQRSTEPDATYERVDRDLTLLLHGAAEDCGRSPVFVYLSSIGADAPRANRYLQARRAVEAALAKGSIPWVVARPSFITGPDRPEDRPAERFGAAAADLALGALGLFGATRLRDRYASLTGAELARALAALAEDPKALRTAVETDGLRRYL